MEDSAQVSKEEKEALINAKMEQIRKKNEELLKRHKEVEADKMNAEVFSKVALEHKTTTQSQHTDRKPPVRNYTPRVRQPKHAQEQSNLPDHSESRRQQQRLQDGDGPPPDPAYSFLSDRTREGQLSDGRSRRHVGNFGGPDFTNVRSTMQHSKTRKREMSHYPPRNKMEMSLYMTGRERREYQQWREERNKVEEERLARQKTASGQWRREWDRAKDEPSQTTHPDTPDPRGSTRRQTGTGRGQESTYQQQRFSKANTSPDPNLAPSGDFDSVPCRSRSGGSRSFRGQRASNSSQSEDEKPMFEDSKHARSNYYDDRKSKTNLGGNANPARKSGSSDEAEKSTPVLHQPVQGKSSDVLPHTSEEQNSLQDGDDDSWEDATTSGNESTVSEANIQDSHHSNEYPRIMDSVVRPSSKDCCSDIDSSHANESDLNSRKYSDENAVTDSEPTKIVGVRNVNSAAIEGELQNEATTTSSVKFPEVESNVESNLKEICADIIDVAKQSIDSSVIEGTDPALEAETSNSQYCNDDNIVSSSSNIVHKENSKDDSTSLTFPENVNDTKEPVKLEEATTQDSMGDCASEIQMESSTYISVNEIETNDVPVIVPVPIAIAELEEDATSTISSDIVPALLGNENLQDDEQIKDLLEKKDFSEASVDVTSTDSELCSLSETLASAVKSNPETGNILEAAAANSDNNAELSTTVEKDEFATSAGEGVSSEQLKANGSND